MRHPRQIGQGLVDDLVAPFGPSPTRQEILSAVQPLALYVFTYLERVKRPGEAARAVRRMNRSPQFMTELFSGADDRVGVLLQACA